MKVFIEWGHCALDKASIKIEIEKHNCSLIQCCHLQLMRKSASKNSKLREKDFALYLFSFKLFWVADEMVRSGLSVSLLRYTSVPCQPMWKQMMVLKLESTWSNKLYETTTSLPKSFNYWAGNDSQDRNLLKQVFLKSYVEVSRILFIFGHQDLEQKSLFCGKIPTLLPTVVTVGRSPKAAALITPTCAESIPSISLS